MIMCDCLRLKVFDLALLSFISEFEMKNCPPGLLMENRIEPSFFAVFEERVQLSILMAELTPEV